MGKGGAGGSDDETLSEHPERARPSIPHVGGAGRPSGTWRLRAAESFAPGTIVDGAYRILDRVGEGAMGVVLRAHDIHLDRDVAIKVIRPSVVERPDARERFLGEARAMARIRHPNVVEVYALGEWDALPYIVMEYIHGMTLEEWLSLREDRPPTIDEALSVLDQLCLGVEAIHASGAAHRDLKPSNVLVGPGFRVAVADFGISRSFRESGHSGTLGSGTPTMMAPEVVLGTVAGARALESVDVYALGVLAYRLLVGRYPFEGTGPEVMAKHVSEPPPLPRSLAPTLPAAFEGALLDALAKFPAERTASVALLRRALHAANEETHRPSHALRFLVVEDDAVFRGLVTQILLRGFPGATIEQAPDGQTGLAAAERNPPSAILTDLDMPVMTGLELTAAVRESAELAGIPIIIMTGNGTPADWRALSRMGADAFLVKPFDAAHAIALLRAMLGRTHAAREA
jgi:serine/threonine-protein kinase